MGPAFRPAIVRSIDAPLTFHSNASLNPARYLHAATLQSNGLVLVARGYGGGGAKLKGSWP